jgi:hypothetical protein
MLHDILFNFFALTTAHSRPNNLEFSAVVLAFHVFVQVYQHPMKTFPLSPVIYQECQEVAHLAPVGRQQHQ